MLDIFSQYATDESLENNGTWFEIGGGARLLIARAGNKPYARFLTKQVERNRRILDREDETADSKSEEIMTRALAQYILLGWEGITYQGQALEYSRENAEKLLGLKDFRAEVMKFANDIDYYKSVKEVEQGEA